MSKDVAFDVLFSSVGRISEVKLLTRRLALLDGLVTGQY